MADYEEGTDKQSKLDLAHARWRLVCDTGTKQRDREQQDLAFLVPENQWDTRARAAREGGEGQAARPVLSVSKVGAPLKLVYNQMRSADLGVNITPVHEDADDETALTFQGLYRHIDRNCHAERARAWAFKRASAAGRGAYRILTEYDPQGGHPTDQRIVIRRVLHQESVFFDPAAEEQDCSDGKFVFYVAWVPRKDFRKEYPDAKGNYAEKAEWEALSTEAPEWVRDEDLLVAEYWYRESHKRKIKARGKVVGEQEYYTVHRCILTGGEIIEETDWPGQYLPWVLVIGEELLPFDQERRYSGLIHDAMDGQRLFNVAASTLVERMLLEPKAPFVGYSESFEPFKEWWLTANQKNYPYLPVARGTAQEPLPLPQRSQLDTTGMSMAAMVIQQADNFIQSTTAMYDPSLGRESARDKSGKAILALQQQADEGSSHFVQNLADAMEYEAKVVLDLLPHIYDRPGRITRILRGDDDKSESVMLNKPFVRDPATGRPRAVPKMMQGAKLFDLTVLARGGYDIHVKVGKSFQTRAEQGKEFMGQILEAMPEYLPLLGDLFFKFQDAPGADEISKRLAKLREQKYPGLGEGEDGQQMNPEQAQAQMAGLKQQLEMAQQQLQLAIQEIKTDQAKQQATLEKARMDNEARVMVAAIQQQETAKDDALKAMLQQMKQEFEKIQNALDRQQELTIHREEMAHEVAMADAAGRTFNVSRQDGQERGREDGPEGGEA